MKDAKNISIVFSTIENKSGQYIIDEWQRSYEWSKEQWCNLFNTINSINLQTKEKKWIGNFIFYCPNDRDALIVDGQQRLTTITILMAVIRDLSNNICQGNDLSLRIYRNLVDRDNHNFFVFKNNKITNSVYSSIICKDFIGINDEYKSDAFYLAYDYYKKLLKPYTFDDLNTFYNKMCNLVVNINECESYDEALEVFESVNGKGKHVTTNDNIKTRVCKIIHDSTLSEHDKNEYNIRINDLSKKLNKGTGKSFYCRFLYNMTDIYYTKSKIYGKFLSCIKTIEDIKNIFDFFEYETYFDGFNHPALLIINNDCKKYGISLKTTQNILKIFTNMIIRSTVCGKGLIHEEAFCGVVKNLNITDNISYVELANQIHTLITEHKLYKNELEIFSDSEFITCLETYDLYNAKHNMAKDILWKLNDYFEKQTNNKETAHIDNPTIDHINPQINNSKYMNTLGNLTILSQPANSSKNKKDTTHKNSMEKIKNSSLKINNNLMSSYNLSNGWNDVDILKRTKDLGKILCNIL